MPTLGKDGSEKRPMKTPRMATSRPRCACLLLVNLEAAWRSRAQGLSAAAFAGLPPPPCRGSQVQSCHDTLRWGRCFCPSLCVQLSLLQPWARAGVQVVFSSRTHSQLRQTMAELQRTGFAGTVSAVTLGSRKARPALHSAGSLHLPAVWFWPVQRRPGTEQALACAGAVRECCRGRPGQQ